MSSSRPTVASAAAPAGPAGGRRASPGRYHLPGHVAPAADRARPGRPAAARAGRAVQRRPGTRSSSPTAAPPRSGTRRVRPGPDRAQFATFGEFGAVRAGGFGCTVSECAVRAVGRARHRRLAGRRGRRRHRTPSRTTTTGVIVPVRGSPGPTRARSCSPTRPRPPARSRSTWARPTSTTSRRRRCSAPTAGSGSRSCLPRPCPGSSR